MKCFALPFSSINIILRNCIGFAMSKLLPTRHKIDNWSTWYNEDGLTATEGNVDKVWEDIYRENESFGIYLIEKVQRKDDVN